MKIEVYKDEEMPTPVLDPVPTPLPEIKDEPIVVPKKKNNIGLIVVIVIIVIVVVTIIYFYAKTKKVEG